MTVNPSAESLQLDALAAQRALRERIIELATSYRPLRDPQIMHLCQQAWASDERRGGVVGQLWVEGIFPSQEGEQTLRDLARIDEFDRDLLNLLDLGANGSAGLADRRLYQHQQDSLRAQSNPPATISQGTKPAIVVSAGTGAGKTEAFLLPVLNDLFQHPRRPGETGVRTILLYPMNALVNDQVDRLYRWLDAQERVTFLHFTSETPEDERALKRSSLANRRFSKCRLMTREAGRNTPPDILITNYSMLEYMLCRPQDAPFFSSALRALVLDEAAPLQRNTRGGNMSSFASRDATLRRIFQRLAPDRHLRHFGWGRRRNPGICCILVFERQVSGSLLSRKARPEEVGDSIAAQQ